MEIKLADNALTTLETIKRILQIPQEEQTSDDILIQLINAASAWVETMTDRKFGLAEYKQKCIGTNSQKLVLEQYPIVSVESVKDNGADLLTNQYDWKSEGKLGILYREDSWKCRGYSYGLSGDIVSPQRYIEVNYHAGYILPKDGTEENPSTLPADLEQVVWGIVEQEYLIRSNGTQGLSAFSISDVSWTFDKQPRQSWMDVIWRYRRL